jgi:hypothetical protein
MEPRCAFWPTAEKVVAILRERLAQTVGDVYCLEIQLAQSREERDREKARAEKAEAEVKRLRDDNMGAYGCLRMIADTLTGIGCSHGPETHNATPPMMYPEWIMCCLKHHTKRLREKVDDQRRRLESIFHAAREAHDWQVVEMVEKALAAKEASDGEAKE